jgi:hypothetical protein
LSARFCEKAGVRQQDALDLSRGLGYVREQIVHLPGDLAHGVQFGLCDEACFLDRTGPDRVRESDLNSVARSVKGRRCRGDLIERFDRALPRSDRAKQGPELISGLAQAGVSGAREHASLSRARRLKLPSSRFTLPRPSHGDATGVRQLNVVVYTRWLSSIRKRAVVMSDVTLRLSCSLVHAERGARAVLAPASWLQQAVERCSSVDRGCGAVTSGAVVSAGRVCGQSLGCIGAGA